MLDEFTRSYIECALWASLDDNEQPLDSNYDINDFNKATLQQMIIDCKLFQEDNFDLLRMAYKRPDYTSGSAGHDFFLTRNFHGAGFWDRGLMDVGEQLSEKSHDWGSFDLYVGDDKKVHC